MGIVQDELKNMLVGEVRSLKSQDCGFNPNDKGFIAVVEAAIHLALQGQLEIVVPPFVITSAGVRHMDQLCFKRLA